MLQKRVPFWQEFSAWNRDFHKMVSQIATVREGKCQVYNHSYKKVVELSPQDVCAYDLCNTYGNVYFKIVQHMSGNTDSHTARAAGVLSAFKIKGEKIYKISRAFGEELLKVDLDLTGDCIPRSKEVLCIEFPDTISFKIKDGESETFYLRCVFISLTDSKDIIGYPVRKENKTEDEKLEGLFNLWFPQYNKDGSLSKRFTNVDILYRSYKDKFSETLENTENHVFGFNSAIEYAFKCWVYIHSGDPDLREFKPVLPTYTTNRKKLERFHAANPQEALVPMTLVGFNFQKPIEYAVDMTTVSGHFRWQPWGARRERVKLIWIDAHERHYKPIPVLANP